MIYKTNSWFVILAYLLFFSCDFSNKNYMENRKRKFSYCRAKRDIFIDNKKKDLISGFFRISANRYQISIDINLLQIIKNYLTPSYFFCPMYDSKISIFELINGTKIKEIKLDEEENPHHLALTRKPYKLIYSNKYAHFNIISLFVKDKKRIKAHKRKIEGLYYSEEQDIVSYSDDRTIKLWDCFGNEKEVINTNPHNPKSVCSLGKENLAYVSNSLDDNVIRIFNRNTKKTSILKNGAYKLYGIDNHRFASCGGFRTQAFELHGEICIWDLDSNNYKQRMTFKGGVVDSMCKIPKKDIFYFRNNDFLSIYDVRQNNFENIIPGFKNQIKILFVDRYTILSTCFYEYSIKIWDIRNKKCLKAIKIKNANLQSNWDVSPCIY